MALVRHWLQTTALMLRLLAPATSHSAEKSTEWGLPLACAEVDIKGAFDQVTSDTVHQALNHYEVEPAFAFYLLRSICQMSASCTLDNVTTEPFPVGKSCRPGGA